MVSRAPEAQLAVVRATLQEGASFFSPEQQGVPAPAPTPVTCVAPYVGGPSHP